MNPSVQFLFHKEDMDSVVIKKNSPQKSGTIGRGGFVEAGIALLEKVYLSGGGLWGLIHVQDANYCLRSLPVPCKI